MEEKIEGKHFLSEEENKKTQSKKGDIKKQKGIFIKSWFEGVDPNQTNESYNAQILGDGNWILHHF